MYLIEIKKIEPPSETNKFESTVGIYEQRVENLDIEAVIAVINKLEKPKAN